MGEGAATGFAQRAAPLCLGSVILPKRWNLDKQTVDNLRAFLDAAAAMDGYENTSVKAVPNPLFHGFKDTNVYAVYFHRKNEQAWAFTITEKGLHWSCDPKGPAQEPGLVYGWDTFKKMQPEPAKKS